MRREGTPRPLRRKKIVSFRELLSRPRLPARIALTPGPGQSGLRSQSDRNLTVQKPELFMPFVSETRYQCLVAEIRVINFLLVAPFYDHLCFGPGDQAGSRPQPRLRSKAGQKIQVCLRRRRWGVSSRLIHGEFTASGCQAKRLSPPGRGWYFNFGN